MADERHHKYGPSTLDSLSLCVRFKFRVRDGDDAADEGTLLHKAFETGDLRGLTDEQASCVRTIRDYVDALKFEHGMTPADWKDFSETEVVLKGLTFGTADRLILCEKTGRLHVIDAKFTRVDAEHDMQLRTYGAAFTEDWNERYPGAIKTVVTHVVAPRLGPSEPVEYDADVLIGSVREYLETLYARIENPFTPPSPHEDLCGRCDRAAECPALAGTIVRTASRMGLPMPERFSPEVLVSPGDRACAQVLANVLINWGELVKANNAEFVSGGGEIPAFRMVRKSTGVRVPKRLTRDAIDTLVAAGLVKAPDDVLGCCSITFGDLVKQISLSEGVSETDAKERVREVLGDLAVEGTCEYLAKERRIADGDVLKSLIGGNQTTNEGT